MRQRVFGRIAILQMRHQAARAELRQPGRVAGPRHQGLAQRRGAVQHQGGMIAMGESVFIGLGGIAGQRQGFQQVETHSDRPAARLSAAPPARLHRRENPVDPPIFDLGQDLAHLAGLPARPPPSPRGR